MKIPILTAIYIKLQHADPDSWQIGVMASTVLPAIMQNGLNEE
jgi:hypothetical protein